MSEFLIPLSQGKVAQVSAADFANLSNYKWQATLCSGHWYARRNLRGGRGAPAIYMHREIMLPSGKLIVDHINGDGLDNRRENLRVTNYSGNNANARKRKSATGFRGVYPQANGFIGRIGFENQDHYVGRFTSAIEAAFFVNQKIDEICPGYGGKNDIDYGALLSIFEERRNTNQRLIDLVLEERSKA